MSAIYPPLPRPNPMTQFFWDGCKARKLQILRCQACGWFVHYPRPVCNKSLYAYTLTMQAFHPYYVDKLPYTLAVVELEEQPGLRITTNIVDVAEADLKTGMPVRLAWREVAPDVVLPMFTKADA
jgi:uncharacterized OB-fold protein